MLRYLNIGGGGGGREGKEKKNGEVCRNATGKENPP